MKAIDLRQEKISLKDLLRLASLLYFRRFLGRILTE